MRVGSLFAGVGGLEQGLVMVLPDAHPVWFSEVDKAACKVLAHRYPGAPNHGDITAIDWTAVEPVDVLTGGWPCQPWSTAGLRKGIEDERALWPEVARAVRALRPRLVVLENVAAIASAGELGRAVGDLAHIGYDTQWRCVRASDVGAPHRRARIFITARLADANGGTWNRGEHGGSEWLHVTPRSASADAADVGHQRSGDTRGWWPRSTDDGAATPADTPFAERRESEQPDLATPPGRTAEPRERLSPTAWGAYEHAIRRWEHALGRPAPAPTILSAKGNPRLSGAFVEWLMGYPAGWITDTPGVTNNDALRLCGNGVVPAQAAAALRLMLGRDAHLPGPVGASLPTPRATRGGSSTEMSYRLGGRRSDANRPQGEVVIDGGAA